MKRTPPRASALLVTALALGGFACSKTPKVAEVEKAAKAVCACEDADCANARAQAIATTGWENELTSESDRSDYIEAVGLADDCARKKGGVGIPGATFLRAALKAGVK